MVFAEATMNETACYIVNDLLDALDEMRALLRELNPGATEAHRRIEFYLERVGRQVEEAQAALAQT
jgi:hypothetical protein